MDCLNTMDQINNIKNTNGNPGTAKVDPVGGELQWDMVVPIFKNKLILKQLGYAMGVPFGLVIVILAALSRDNKTLLYAFGLIVALLVLTWVFIMIVYGGKYQVLFRLDHEGISCSTRASQAKKNSVINGLTIALGLLSNKMSATGAGILAQSNQDVFIKWKNIKKVKFFDNSHTIQIKGGWSENIALFCTEENYAGIKDYVSAITKNHK